MPWITPGHLLFNHSESKPKPAGDTQSWIDGDRWKTTGTQWKALVERANISPPLQRT